MKRILSINDQFPTTKLIEFTFNKEGYNVTSISDEKGAMDSLSRETFDLIMLNITSETIEWINILKTVKNDSRHTKIPILTITCKSSGDKTKEASKLGTIDFINYPFKPRELLGIVSNILEECR